MADRITFDDLKAMTEDWISPDVAASVLRMDKGRLITYAKEGRTPFACRISGNRVLVNRKSLLKEFGQLEDEKQEKADHQLIAEKLDKIMNEVHQLNIGLASLVAVILASNQSAAGLLEKLQFAKEGLQ